MTTAPTSQFIWVEGSPSAAENPPHDRRWRAAIAVATRGAPATVSVELDFLLELRRVLIDIDNLVRPALDGMRDSGVLRRGAVGLDLILATKRPASSTGLGLTVVPAIQAAPPPPVHKEVQLVVRCDVIPREGRYEEKLAWQHAVRNAWSGAVLTGPVAVDVAARTRGSLGMLMKPVIDGLEPYLGRGTVGRGIFRPLDERIVLLRVRRVLDNAVALTVTAGPPTESSGFRVPPPAPALPIMDPHFPHSMSDLEAIGQHTAWRRVFVDAPSWTEVGKSD